MEYAVSYGKQLDFKGFQKTIFMLAQQKYVLAMASGLENGRRRKVSG